MRLLVVSFCFPPEASPRAIQVARLLRHLEGVDVTLVHGKDERSRRDPAIEQGALDRITTRIAVPFQRPAWRRYVTAAAERIDLPLWNRVPDQYASWRRPAFRAIEEWWQVHGPPDLLVTFGNPMTDHLVGLDVARRYHVPWVAHFSDPWVDNPYHRQHALDLAANLPLEGAVIRTADRVAFPSEALAEYTLRRYPLSMRAKAFVLSGAFDPGVERVEPARSGPIVIRHIGEFYGLRSPRPLFDALRTLHSLDPAIVRDLRIELVGGAAPGFFEAAGLGDLPDGLVGTVPHVSLPESIRLMSSADGLLVIDGPSEDGSIFLPSKLIEYVGVERPIMGIGPAGPATELIASLGGPSADPSEPGRVARELAAFVGVLRERRASGEREWGNPEVRNRFAAPEVARQFLEVTSATLTGRKLHGTRPEKLRQSA